MDKNSNGSPKIPPHNFDSSKTSQKLAHQEAENVGEERLEEEARINQHIRNERKKNFLWWISIIATGIVVIGIVLMAIIWFIHLIIPSCRWMQEKDLMELKTFLFSALVTAIISPFVKMHLSE